MKLLQLLKKLLLRKERKRIHTYASFSTLAEALRFKRALLLTREDVIVETITETPAELLHLCVDDVEQNEVFVFYSAYEPLP